jgi:hypothetical protein
MEELSTLLSDDATAAAAKDRAATLHATIEHEYFRPDADAYAFSWNNGKIDATATVYPAIAWWNGGKGLDHAQGSMRRWASHDFETDWGARDVAASDPLYDSMSYHQGSVWPLFTGWAALAQYRAGSALAGYQATMQNADLTTAQDMGAVTELLSGDFFEPFGRSTSHQLWSSAMVVTPVLRGMFGIDVDAIKHEVAVTPHLPAEWDEASVNRLHVGDAMVDLAFKREGAAMVVSLRRSAGSKVRLAGAPGDGSTLRVPLPGVEIGVAHGLPQRGSRTAQMKVLSERVAGRSMRLEMEGIASSESTLHVRRNDASAHVSVEGGELAGDQLKVRFGAGSGYVTKVVTLRW